MEGGFFCNPIISLSLTIPSCIDIHRLSLSATVLIENWKIKLQIMKLINIPVTGMLLLYAATSTHGAPREETVIDLDAFIVEQTQQAQPESLSPLGTRVKSLFGQELDLMDTPRAVSVITPATRDMLGIDSYDALSKVASGTQRENYFGLAGSAFLRGARAGTYFNGMLRAFNRNEMPMSFGALEGLQLVKGPSPANLSPTLVGGFVLQEPKQPFYDRARSEVKISYGSRNSRRLQVDTGAPFMLGERPAAYRLSYTGNRANRYYDNIRHDYDSIYGSMKVQLSSRQQLFFGAEYYNFRSSEAPGYNRPSADLIRNRQYIIGEAPDITSSAWNNTVVRTLVEYPYNMIVDPAMHALAIRGDIARQRIPENLRQHMIDLSTPQGREQVYRLQASDDVPGFVYNGNPAVLAAMQATTATALAQIDTPLEDAYLYTPEYFAAGGKVLTDEISRRSILADSRDKADSQDFIFFADLETRLDSERSWRLKFFSEGMETEKESTYGFAMHTRQMLANLVWEWQQILPDQRTTYSAGIDLRGSYAQMAQDFDAEPFSRRDLTQPIRGNSVVTAGPQTGPDGQNYWSTFGGASNLSHLQQLAAFFSGKTQLHEKFELMYGLRAEQAWYRSRLPAKVDRATDAFRESRRDQGADQLYQVSLNPLWKVHSQIHLYGALQFGKAVSPADGGTIAGQSTITDVELYEFGIKARSPDDRFFMSMAVYHWNQSTFSIRDASALPLRGQGFELETIYSPLDSLTLIGGFTAQRVHLRTELLGFGALFLTEEEWALQGGILNAAGGRNVRSSNPDHVMDGVPELSAHLYAAWELPAGFRISGGPLWRDSHWHDMGRNLKIPSAVLWNAQLYWEHGNFSLRLHVDNIFDKDTMIALEPIFAAGTLILPGEGRSWKLSAGYQF